MKFRIRRKYFVILMLLLFSSCNKRIISDSKILDYNYKKLDGVLIYNRSYNVIIFNLIKDVKSNLVFVNYDNNIFKIIKKPKNYSLNDNEILILIKEYKDLHCVYCYVDYNNIIKIISKGIDYVRINQKYNDTNFLFNENKYKYQYIGNDWYVKKDNTHW